MVPAGSDAYHAGSLRARRLPSAHPPVSPRPMIVPAAPFLAHQPNLLLLQDEQSGKPDLFLLIAVFVAIFWFVAILPERKQRKKKAAMMDSMKKNDRVLLSSGMYATIAAIGEQDLTVKFDDGPTRVKILKSAISSVLDKDGDEVDGKS
jgi:preprotein translocase subunit YajC